MKKSRQGGMLLLAAVAIALTLIALRWRRTSFEWTKFQSTFVQLDWLWLAAALALVLLTYVGRVLRWEVILRPIRPKSSFWNLFSATTIGFTAVVLFGRPGELVRPYLISVKENVPFSSQVAAWFLERVFDLLVVLLLFGFALSQVSASGLRPGPKLTWILEVGGYIVAAMCVACLAVLLLMRGFSPKVEAHIFNLVSFLGPAQREKVRHTLSALSQGVESTRNSGFALLILLYSVVEWALIALCYVCLFHALPATAHIGLTQICIFVGFVSFGSIVQIPGIGGGMQVAAIVVLTELFGLPLEVSTGLAVLIWIFTFVVVVPFGLILAFREGLSWRKLKQIEGEASL